MGLERRHRFYSIRRLRLSLDVEKGAENTGVLWYADLLYCIPYTLLWNVDPNPDPTSMWMRIRLFTL
jgi:hypothetical protein